MALTVLPLLGFSALLGFGTRGDPAPRADPMHGRRAPSFVLEGVDGGELSSAELRGRILVVNFFASWCAACREEHPALRSTASQFAAGDVRLIGIAFQDTAADAAAFGRDLGGDWPLLLDPDGRVAIGFGVAGVPETFVVGADGTIRRRFIGPVSEDGLVAAIDEALSAGGPT